MLFEAVQINFKSEIKVAYVCVVKDFKEISLECVQEYALLQIHIGIHKQQHVNVLRATN